MLRTIDAVLILFAMINVISFALYGMDKYRARRNQWRIRERVLLGVAWLMGGVGAWLGMQVFRHKTKHRAFALGVPTAAILQILLMAAALMRLSGI